MPPDAARLSLRRHAIGDRLRRVRRRSGWTQQQLASTARVDRAFLSNVERGRVGCSVDWLCDVADALGVDPWELLAGIPQLHDEDGQPPTSPRPPRVR